MPPPVARLTAGGLTQRMFAERHPVVALGVSWPGLWLLAVGLEATAGGVAAWFAGRHGPAVVAVLVNLLVALRFAVTLRPGSDPLISRYASHDTGGALPARAERYTRTLTRAWAWLLVLFALAHGMAAWDWWPTATIASAQAVTCVVVFLAEHVLRGWLLPELGRSSPLRTLRAIWLHASQDTQDIPAPSLDDPQNTAAAPHAGTDPGRAGARHAA